MRNTIILVAAIFAGLLLLSGCGYLAGNDPEGVTGGHIGGYGSFGTNYSGGYEELYGDWRHNGQSGSYEILTFHSNSEVQIEFFDATGTSQSVHSGSYAISGNRLDMSVNGWMSGSYTLSIETNTLTIAGENQSTSYTKIR
jgi:hypothetical protein